MTSIEHCCSFTRLPLGNDLSHIGVYSAYSFLLSDVSIISASKLLLLCVEWKHLKENKNNLKSGLSFRLQDLSSPSGGGDLKSVLEPRKEQGRVLSLEEKLQRRHEAELYKGRLITWQMPEATTEQPLCGRG